MQRRHSIGMVVILLASAVACEAPPLTQLMPQVELPTYTPNPTHTPYPTYTPRPTYTMAPVPTNTATPVPTNTAEPAPTNTPRPETTPRPTRIPPAEMSELGKRSNPIPFGERVELVKDEEMVFEVAITDVLRGADAWEKITARNRNSDPPEEGMEYIMAFVEIDYLDGPADEPLELNRWRFDAVSNAQVLDQPPVAIPEPEFRVSFFPGASGEGWVVLSIFQDDSAPLLVFDVGYDSEFYFSIAPTAEVADEATPVEEAKDEVEATATASPEAPVVQPIGSGIFIVGTDIEPGVYKLEGDICLWERLSCLDGSFSCVIEQGGLQEQGYVEVLETDLAFKASCF